MLAIISFRRAGWPVTVSAILALGIVASRRQTVVGTGRPIRHDDWTFTVREVARSAAGPGPGRVVTLEVANLARRVDYHFRPANVLLVDGLGRRHRAIRVDGPAPPIVIPPGATRRFVLEYPADMGPGGARLCVTSGGPVGDFLEALLAGRQSIELDGQPGAGGVEAGR